jgi:hypothetical protein
METWEQRPDTELLLEARTHSEAFGVFYERHFASVLTFFRRRVPGPEEAFDLTAETFAAALASVPLSARTATGPGLAVRDRTPQAERGPASGPHPGRGAAGACDAARPVG